MRPGPGQAVPREECVLKGILGKKVGMTQIYAENGEAVPVTVIEAGPCWVTQTKTVEKDGYSAVQLGFEEIKPSRLTRGQLGHLGQLDMDAKHPRRRILENDVPPLRYLREFRSLARQAVFLQSSNFALHDLASRLLYEQETTRTLEQIRRQL